VHYLKHAIELAKSSDHPKTKVGAILVSGKHILASASNSTTRSHPLQKYYNVKYRNIPPDSCKHLIHAEMSCLVQSIEIPANSRLYIARVLKMTNTIVMASPCKACLQAIIDFNIHNIYYTTELGFAHEKLNYAKRHERINQIR